MFHILTEQIHKLCKYSCKINQEIEINPDYLPQKFRLIASVSERNTLVMLHKCRKICPFFAVKEKFPDR